jgi:hypothetical protein
MKNKRNNMDQNLTQSGEKPDRRKSLKQRIPLNDEDNENIEDIGSEVEEEVNEGTAKKKKDWNSWTLNEKLLFYQAIASGGNYTSLQKLFQNMNDVFFEKI